MFFCDEVIDWEELEKKCAARTSSQREPIYYFSMLVSEGIGDYYQVGEPGGTISKELYTKKQNGRHPRRDRRHHRKNQHK